MPQEDSSSSESNVAGPGKGRVYGMHGSEAGSRAKARVPMTISLTPEMRDMIEDARDRAGGMSNVELIVRLLRFFVKYEVLWPVILGWPGRFSAPVQSVLDRLRSTDEGSGLDARGGVTHEGEEPQA